MHALGTFTIKVCSRHYHYSHFLSLSKKSISHPIYKIYFMHYQPHTVATMSAVSESLATDGLFVISHPLGAQFVRQLNEEDPDTGENVTEFGHS